jgi:hypothetical protein
MCKDDWCPRHSRRLLTRLLTENTVLESPMSNTRMGIFAERGVLNMDIKRSQSGIIDTFGRCSPHASRFGLIRLVRAGAV